MRTFDGGTVAAAREQQAAEQQQRRYAGPQAHDLTSSLRQAQALSRAEWEAQNSQVRGLQVTDSSRTAAPQHSTSPAS